MRSMLFEKVRKQLRKQLEKITVESKDIQMPACQEQFNLTKSETGESEIIAFESNDEETAIEKITVESKDILKTFRCQLVKNSSI